VAQAKFLESYDYLIWAQQTEMFSKPCLKGFVRIEGEPLLAARLALVNRQGFDKELIEPTVVLDFGVIKKLPRCHPFLATFAAKSWIRFCLDVSHHAHTEFEPPAYRRRFGFLENRQHPADRVAMF
jgi:hypothetical protein